MDAALIRFVADHLAERGGSSQPTSRRGWPADAFET
jgi:hypothetical protein